MLMQNRGMKNEAQERLWQAERHTSVSFATGTGFSAALAVAARFRTRRTSFEMERVGNRNACSNPEDPNILRVMK